MEEIRQNLIDSLLAQNLLEGVEGFGSSLTDILVMINQGDADSRDKNLLVVFQTLWSRGCDELTQGDTDTLLDVHIGRCLQSLFEQRQQSREHRLASLLDKISKGVAGNDLLFHVGGSETADDELGQGWQHILESSRGGNQSLPDGHGGTLDHAGSIAAADEQSRQNLVSALFAENLEQGLAGLLGFFLFFVGLGLARNTCKAEQEISNQLDGTETDTVAVVGKTTLELGKKEIDGLGGEVLDKQTTSTQGGLTDRVDVISQTSKDRRNDLAEVVGEAGSEASGQEDEEGHEALANSGLGAGNVLEDGRQSFLESGCTQTSKHLGKGLGRSESVASTGIRLECVHEVGDEVWQSVFAKLFDKRTHRLGSSCPSSRNGIDDSQIETSNDNWQVCNEILTLSKMGQATNNLG